MRHRLVHLQTVVKTIYIGMCCVIIALRSEAQTLQTLEAPPATHNMMIVGEDKAFLSNLPMFNKGSKDHTVFCHRIGIKLSWRRP
jgi:hypothetical protein